MAAMRRLVDSWDALPVGARAALDQQWAALAAGGLPYEALGDPLWWTISNLLFLYNSARYKGEASQDAPA